MQKKILHVLDSRRKKITETESVLQPLPHKEFRFANPLIVLHHMTEQLIQPGSENRIHPHPHRGFSPVTLMLQGEGFHKDNHGGEGTLKAGDAQWMFAGSGLLHSEGPSSQLLENGGPYELIQLWINSPASIKNQPPTYQLAKNETQPLIPVTPGVQLRLVAGTYDGKKGPLVSHTPVTLMIGSAEKKKQLQLTARPGYWTLLYLIRGELLVGPETIKEHQLVVFEKANDELLLSSCTDSQFLVISAEPLDEPLAAAGNFVMNTIEEIRQAEADYKDGKFGILAG